MSGHMGCGLCSGARYLLMYLGVHFTSHRDPESFVGRVLIPLGKVTTSLQPTYIVASLMGGPCHWPLEIVHPILF